MKSKNRVSDIGKLAAVVTKSFSSFMGLFALIVSAGCGGGSPIVTPPPPPPPPVLAAISATIPVGRSPSAIAVDSTSNKIYVTDFGMPSPLGGHFCSPSAADVMVIDGATESTISVGFGFVGWASLDPFAVTVNPANHTFYVLAKQFGLGFGRTCGYYSDGVEVFDTTSLTQTMNIADLGHGLRGIDVNPSTGSIYVAQVLYSSNVVVLDSGGKVVATMPVGAGPAGVAVNATTNKIYVANSGSDDISVIDGATNSVSTIADPNAMAPVAVAVNPTTNTIYVANAHSNNLTVIDGATGSITATVAVGTSPSGVAVDAQRNVIYVANAGSPQNPGNVTVIESATKTTTLTDSKAVNPVAVAVDSATNKIYVANSGSNNITVIDGAH